MSAPHGTRKHSKFSASGAERWTNCPGSVALSEGVPDKQNEWTLEGTLAHEVLEGLLKELQGAHYDGPYVVPREMMNHGEHAAAFIFDLHKSIPGSELSVESRVYLDFIHPEMFGTYDSAVIEHFGTLHVFDYKYGARHAVSPTNNLQMIFYGLGVAAKYDYNFKRVRLWIIQPRIKGYDGPTYWDVSIAELKKFAAVFDAAVYRVEKFPDTYEEGTWCPWCKAKKLCPKKKEAKLQQSIEIFSNL